MLCNGLLWNICGDVYHQRVTIPKKCIEMEIRGKRIVENRVSAHAARLVANYIITSNSIILNFVYEKLLAAGAPQEIIDKFPRISLIAWTHTLLTGRYSFMKSNGQIDVEAMAQILEDHVKQHFWSDQGEGLNQENMVQSELDIVH